MQRINTFELARYGADLQRRMHDMPVGDPMSGAPYGEYLKSKALGMVIGVVASIVTMGAAAPLLASAVLATQIAGGVMMAGGVLSGVGAITGNKKLSKIGGIMSLAGGIGALASTALNGAGVGGAFASGSGSEAVSTMATSFMESANSVSGGLLYSDAASAAEAAKATGGELGLDTATASPVADSQAGITETALAEPSAASAPGSEAGTIDGKNAVVQAEAPKPTVTIDQAPSAAVPDAGGATPATDAMARGEVYGPTKPPVEEPGILSRANSFLSDNKELLKTGAGALEMGMKYGMGGDTAEAQEAYYQAAAAKSGAETAYLTTKNDELKWQMENQNKKSIMLSADDPMLEQKMAQAKADGVVVGVIPNIGAGGIKQTGPTAFSTAQAGAGQQVVRQPTFNAPAPTPQRAA
jgi:hypothetical protein